MVTKRCAHCGRSFETDEQHKGKQFRFCSKKCRNREAYKRNREKILPRLRGRTLKQRMGRFCEVCGEPISIERRVSAIYCSKKCERVGSSKKMAILRKQRLLKIEKILGNKCILCGEQPAKSKKASKRNLLYHEINYKKHSGSAWYVLKYIEDFIPLCFACHLVVHYLYRKFGITLGDLRGMIQNG